jgi:hypothetical protein
MVDTVPDALPLAAAQEGIWTGQEYDRASPAFNTAEYVEIHGPVDVVLLESAIRRTVAETDAVHVVFAADEEGRTWQRFRTDLGWRSDGRGWPVLVIDVSDEDDPLAAALAWMRADLTVPVDLRTDILFCHALIRLGDDHLLWYQRVHHIALDGYGLSLVARRVAEVYTALVEGRDPTPRAFGSLESVVTEDQSYLDSEKCATAREYWPASPAPCGRKPSRPRSPPTCTG